MHTTIFYIFSLAYLVTFFECKSDETKSPRITIIGAGASGISAALQLLNNGFDNIKILEAENRIGGRIYSTHFGEGIIDLGAEYVIENSTVYNLVSDQSLLENAVLQSEVYHSKAGRLSENFLKVFFERLVVFLYQNKPESDSWKQFFVNQLNPTVIDHFESNADKLLVKDSINFIEKSFMHITAVTSLDDVCGQGNGDFHPDYRYVWKRGFTDFLHDFIKTYLKSKTRSKLDDLITLKTEVKNIEWDDVNLEVRLTCDDGSNHLADHVIVTLPLGVLKKQQNSLFTPPLPDKKQKAIESLGMGSMLKIAYYFPNKWWNDSNFMFVWSNDDLYNVDFNRGPSKNGQSWVTNFMGFTLLPDNPNVLFALYLGDLISEVELCSEDVLLDGAYYVLQKFLGEVYKNITKPTKLIFNGWSNNPHFHGVVSYETVESIKRNLSGEDLAEPVLFNHIPRLLFAGEATNKIGFASVNGAISSGFREANRVVDYYKKLTNKT